MSHGLGGWTGRVKEDGTKLNGQGACLLKELSLAAVTLVPSRARRAMVPFQSWLIRPGQYEFQSCGLGWITKDCGPCKDQGHIFWLILTGELGS